jgi:chromosome partitioning protein
VKTVVVFNMRGGIGKTTTAVALAESLAFFSGLRVLVADADLQRSSSLRLCELAHVNECSRPSIGKNIGKYLTDAIVRNQLPHAQDYITRRCGTVHGQGQVDLLTGTLDTLSADQYFAGRRMIDGDRQILTKLSDAFKHLGQARDYDVLIIDAPPAPGTIVQAALCMADLLLVPMIAQSTSELMFGGTQKQIEQQLIVVGARVPEIMVLATMYDAANRNFFERMKIRFGSQLKLKKQKSFSETELFSAEHGKTIRTKYGTGEPDLKALANAVLGRLGVTTTKSRRSTKEDRDVSKRRGNNTSAVARAH